jgi:hypothetical protein
VPDINEIPLWPRGHWAIDVGWATDMPRVLKGWAESPGLDLNPDFQRGLVWSMAQKTAYIEYVLQGGEYGKEITFNSINWDGRDARPIQILDGKQRLDAAMAFMADKVPAFGHLRSAWTGPMRTHIGFKFRMLSLENREQILKYYLGLNNGGTNHTPEEIERVRQLQLTEAMKENKHE